MLDFSQKAEERNNDLIPQGTLVWAVLNLRGVKSSQNTNKEGYNSRYLDLELTIDEGQPYGRRKIWTMIGDPLFGGNTEEYRNMGLASIRRILETAFGASPENPESYKVLQDYQQLSGQRVPVKVIVRKGKDGYDDKNDVEFLSPHSSVKSVAKAFQDLKEGKHTPPAGKAPAGAPAGLAAGLGSTAVPQGAPAQGAQPSWLQAETKKTAPF